MIGPVHETTKVERVEGRRMRWNIQTWRYELRSSEGRYEQYVDAAYRQNCGGYVQEEYEGGDTLEEAVEMGRINVVEVNQGRRSGLPSFVEMAQLNNGEGEEAWV
jgi:hypothetical protein